MKNFSFDTINDFDKHLALSVPNYDILVQHIESIASYFLKKNSFVYDLGCSTGLMISKLADIEPTVNFIGVDKSENLIGQYSKNKSNVEILNCNIIGLKYENDINLILSIFTLQFLPPDLRLDVLKNIYTVLNRFGALIIAEKTYCSNGYLQDLMNFSHYDFKRKNFTDTEILDKQLSLRRIMFPVTAKENIRQLKFVGFKTIYCFWQSLSFKAWLCIK